MSVARTMLIRGTSGSGKSTVVTRLLSSLPPPASDLPHLTRRGPVGRLWPDLSFAVLGRYKTACGGCDWYHWRGAADEVEAHLHRLHEDGISVLFEGLVVGSWGCDRLLRLPSLVVSHLTTPMDECVRSVVARSVASGKPVKSDPYWITTKHTMLETKSRKQALRGVMVYRDDRDQCLARATAVAMRNYEEFKVCW